MDSGTISSRTEWGEGSEMTPSGDFGLYGGEAVAIEAARPHEFSRRVDFRDRLLSGQWDRLADQEILEMILSQALPDADAQATSFMLLSRFGSFAAAVSAPASLLSTVAGMTTAGAAALKTVQFAAKHLARSDIIGMSVINDWDKLMNYLNVTHGRESTEYYRVLLLDSRNRLLADELLGRGSVNRVSVYPRDIVKLILEFNATAVIMVHNHPSGDVTPSDQDIDYARFLMEVLSHLSVTLHDCTIIGNGNWLSLRREGFI